MSKVHTSIIVAAALTLIGLTACGKSEPPPKAEDTVFGPYIKAKDRAAQETEKAMQANKQKLEEAMKKNDDAPTQ